MACSFYRAPLQAVILIGLLLGVFAAVIIKMHIEVRDLKVYFETVQGVVIQNQEANDRIMKYNLEVVVYNELIQKGVEKKELMQAPSP